VSDKTSTTDQAPLAKPVEEASFTPGPWHVFEYCGAVEVNAEGERAIAELWGRGNQAQALANALLIAAAPDLLAALESVLPLLDKDLLVSHWARAAIKKARAQ
jgi:hypothetical protein